MEHLTEEKEIELYDYLKVIYEYKYFIVIVSILCGLAGYAVKERMEPSIRVASLNILLSFAGIEKGEYPDGTKFDKNDIIKPEVISQALKEVNLESKNLDSTTIQFLIKPYIREVIPDALLKEKEEYEKKNLKPFGYNPNEFAIRFLTPVSAGISPVLYENFLEAILSAWTEDFQNKYIQYKMFVPLLGIENLEEYEFFDILDIIEEKMKLVGIEIDRFNLELKRFRSTQYGMSPMEIKMLMDNFVRFDVYKMKSVLDSGLIYKNKIDKMRYLNLKIDDSELARSQKQSEYEFLLNMLKEMKEVRFLPLAQTFLEQPTQMGKGDQKPGAAKEFQEFLKIPDFFPDLMDQLAKAGVASANIEQEIKFLREKIVKIKASAGETTKEKIESITKEMEKLLMKANDLLEMANSIQIEFNQGQLKNFIRKKSSPISSVISNSKKVGLISFAAGLMGAIFLSFFISYLRERRIS